MRPAAGRHLLAAALVALGACGGAPGSVEVPTGGFVGTPPQGTVFGLPFVPEDACAVPASETFCWFPAQGPMQAAGLLLVLSTRPGLGAFLAQHGPDCAARAGDRILRLQFLRAGPVGQAGIPLDLLLGPHAVNAGFSATLDGTTWWGVEATATARAGATSQCREVRRPAVTGTVRLLSADAGRVRGELDLATDDGGFVRGPFEIRACAATGFDACSMTELPYCPLACYP